MFKFEDKIDVIDSMLNKKKGHWQLNTLADLDYDDVSQIIRSHIYKKWNLWDQSRPLENWLSGVINHQIRNLIRNNYGKLAPPCNDCPFNNGGNLCSFTSSGMKDSACKLYSKWEKSRKNGYNIKLALSLERSDFNDKTIDLPIEQSFDLERATQRFHLEMKSRLTPRLYRFYELIYIECKTDEEISDIMKFKNNESGYNGKKRIAGYKQIFNIKSEILKIAKEAVTEFDIVYES